MTTPKKKTTRSTRTRTEVQDEFTDIQQGVASAEAVDPKTAAATRNRASTVRTAVQGLTVEDAVTRVTRLGLDVQRALAGVNEQLLTKVTELEQVTEAVELEKAELENLHKIDVAATAIDMLVQDYTAKSKQLDEQYVARERSYQEQEIEREKARREREVAYATQVQREKDEYEYRKAQERRTADDTFQQQLILKNREAVDRQANLEKNWREREETLRVQENEVTKLRQESQELPIKLRKDFDAEKAIALNSLKSNLEHAHQLQSKDFQAQATIQAATITNLNQQLHAAQEANTRLQQQLAEANSKIETIAKSAIDGSSRRDAFDQLMAVTSNNGTSTPAPRSKA